MVVPFAPPLRVNYGYARSNTDNPFGGVQQVSFQLIFLSPGKYQKNPLQSLAQTTTKNKRKQAETSGPLTDGGGALLTMTFFPLPSLPPLIKQYHSLHKGISIFLDAAA